MQHGKRFYTVTQVPREDILQSKLYYKSKTTQRSLPNSEPSQHTQDKLEKHAFHTATPVEHQSDAGKIKKNLTSIGTSPIHNEIDSGRATYETASSRDSKLQNGKNHEYDLWYSKRRASIKTADSYEVPVQKRGCSTIRKVCIGLLIATLLALIIAAIVLAVVLTRSRTTATTLAPATTTTTTPVPIFAAWNFDNTTTDVYGVYNGQLIDGAEYLPRSSTMPYIGQSDALNLVTSANGSFEVATPFFNLTSISFTVEAWIYVNNLTGIFTIFSQCECSTCSNKCFFFDIRSTSLYAGFTFNDINGFQILSRFIWYHVAFVYDYDKRQQIIYLNGIPDAIKLNANPYQGSAGSIVIGALVTSQRRNFFSGYIDNVRLVTRAKTPSEILEDASLTAHYSFDFPDPTIDSGPNGLNGTMTNALVVTGRINQALRFTGASSYFQAYGFYQSGFGIRANTPYSVSLWINPTLATSSSFVQISTTSNGSSCFNMIGIWSNGGLPIYIIAQGYAWPTLFGPSISLNTWTHVSWTYNTTGGYILYVNGTFYGTTGTFSYPWVSGVINWLQIGYRTPCSSRFVPNAAYDGEIDEIYVHNRALSASEVYALANP